MSGLQVGSELWMGQPTLADDPMWMGEPADFWSLTDLEDRKEIGQTAPSWDLPSSNARTISPSLTSSGSSSSLPSVEPYSADSLCIVTEEDEKRITVLTLQRRHDYVEAQKSLDNYIALLNGLMTMDSICWFTPTWLSQVNQYREKKLKTEALLQRLQYEIEELVLQCQLRSLVSHS